jgi:hypothetical protein
MSSNNQETKYDYPYINSMCDKCIYSYMLEDEMRCRKITLGISSAMCCQVSECKVYKGR